MQFYFAANKKSTLWLRVISHNTNTSKANPVLLFVLQVQGFEKSAMIICNFSFNFIWRV